jgi:hypothetical protein
VTAMDAWRRTAVFKIGGLTELGFVRDTNLVMVVSHQGRGLFDCELGERVARDSSTTYSEWFDGNVPAAIGIGAAGSGWIAVSGLAGGRGIDATAEGWRATASDDEVLLVGPTESQVISDPVSGIRAFSFSAQGQFFALGTPADLSIYTCVDPSRRSAAADRGPFVAGTATFLALLGQAALRR